MLRRLFRFLMLAASWAAVFSRGQSFAVDYAWNVPAGGVQAWTTAANWDPNTGAPITADDTANLSVGLLGNLTADLGPTDVTVGGLTLGGTTVAVTTDVVSTGGRLLLNSTAANATITSGGVSGVINAIKARVGTGPAYLTVDIDVLDPAFAPGTGTPVSGGLSSAQALMIQRGIADIDWRGMDIVEVAPAYDHADITAIAGSTFVQHHLQMLAAKKR